MELEVMKVVKGEDILREARDYIAKKGKWTKGTLGKANGPVCALGALGMVLHKDPREENSDPVMTLRELLDSCVPEKFGNEIDYDIVDYNDHEKTTLKQVIAVFNRAIAKAKKQ